MFFLYRTDNFIQLLQTEQGSVVYQHRAHDEGLQSMQSIGLAPPWRLEKGKGELFLSHL